ncbi:hypothetical protein ABZX85_48460 [Streptomyces sp. NPDC004539]|uniref:hypothetical protein n=1 Tax=Streptomyces sp. NPDC004539 TaxID=3154280 RepID=UPI0033BF4C83
MRNIPPGRAGRRRAGPGLETVTTLPHERPTDVRCPVGSTLPTVRTPADGLGVPSYGTVVTAPGRVPGLVAAVTVGGRTAYWPLPGTASRRAGQLRQTVPRNLAASTHTPGPLPQLASLAREFVLTQRVLGRVLAPLEKDDLPVWGPQGLHVLDQARLRAAPLLPGGREGADRAA